MTETIPLSTARLHVPDMTCGHCEKSVRAALAQALSDAAVDVDLPTHLVQVAGDAETARAALERAGFAPTVV